MFLPSSPHEADRRSDFYRRYPCDVPLSDLDKLELVRVVRGALSPIWRGLMDAYHDLKSGPLCGAQIRYLVHSEAFGWVGALSYSSGQAPVVRAQPERLAPRDWMDEELGRADLGDRRLTARLLQMTGQFYEQPLANIPQACGSTKAAKAAYRFLDNADVQWEAILHSHVQATTDRLHEQETVLVATDTTTLNYSSHPATKGFGCICDNETVRGILVHDTLCFTPEGTPLGLLDVQCWTRETIGSKTKRRTQPIEQKESNKWIKSYRAVSDIQKQCKTTQLATVERLCNCLAIDMIIAWRIFYLTMQGREAPDLRCGLYFSSNEWKALTQRSRYQGVPDVARNIQFVIRRFHRFTQSKVKSLRSRGQRCPLCVSLRSSADDFTSANPPIGTKKMLRTMRRI